MVVLEEQEIHSIDRSRISQVLFQKSPRWVRVRFGGQFVADSKQARLLMEPQRLPVYYFRFEDVRQDLLHRSGRTEGSRQGTRVWWDLIAGERKAEQAAWSFEDPADEYSFLEGYVAFYWDQMDAFLEEDDEVFVHPRDPYHRVDVLQSSRHVQVEIDGVIVADTRRPRLLFETGLPTRYYIPKLDVRMDLLTPTDIRTRCPYKGEAVYWSAEVNSKIYEDIVWSYPAPIPECPKIENHLAFFNENVDAIYVDGEKEPRPKTQWSKK